MTESASRVVSAKRDENGDECRGREWMLKGVALVEISNTLWRIHDLHRTAETPRRLIGNVRKIGNLYGASSVRFPSECPYFDDFDGAIHYVVRLAWLDDIVLAGTVPDTAAAPV